MPTLNDIQEYVDKEAVVHIIQDDGSTTEVIGTIKAATEAGIAFKKKGSSIIELIDSADKIYEIDSAPSRPKSPVRKRMDVVAEGRMRQHLIDRHGIQFSWSKDATEEDAVEFHNSLDHDDLGHYHKAKESDDKSEREQELESN